MSKYHVVESGYHPTGAEFDKDAPYNSKDRNQEVTVSITASKSFRIKCPNDLTDCGYLEHLPEVSALLTNLETNDWTIDEYAVINDN